ncbi:bis(5'-nucleosyl)-tetraphosphatase (symmetrical) YqeK [Salipaludibacillus sp. CF4.18]|uniref:bis(5'-nucleosyl)-tetraphosphatase (symmetrical) YqeK n=1 Tax=Salipaludibacillus sp. CF4.18 TaxID=3373081 RepID=UPI003EE52FE5
MNEVTAFETVQKALKPRRYEHTVRVTEEATRLVGIYGGNLEKIRLAAILHDYAKHRPIIEMRRKVQTCDKLPNAMLDYGDEILHSFVGAVFIEEELFITDETILSCIRSHTTGKVSMSLEEKIVFLADYIEPGRTFRQAEEVRKISDENLDLACLTALGNTIQYLSNKQLPIYPDTFAAYNDFVLR